MMCEKTLRDGIPNGLLRDRTGVEDNGNHLGETRLRWLGHLERMDETNLVKKVREERDPGHVKRGRPKKSWDEVVKEDIKKRGLCINDAQDRNKRRRCCRRVSAPVNWEKDPGHQGKTDKRRQKKPLRSNLIETVETYKI